MKGERPETRDRPSRSKRGPLSWLVSIVFHAGLIALLASLFLRTPVRERPDVVLQLQTETGPLSEARADTDSDDAMSGGAPSLSRASDRTRSDATAAPMPSLPVPADVGAPALTDASLATIDPSGTDPAFAVLAELADAAEAERTVGAGLNPLLQGTSPGFQDMIGGMGGTGLDVVMVLDATDSMDPYIKQAKGRIRDVIGVITGVLSVAGKPPANVRFGVVAFKDYGDDYGLRAVRALPLTGEYEEVRAFIDQIFVGGGGDEPEPIHEALAAATDRRMGWTKKSRNVIVLVGDAPVHGTGRRAALQAAATFAKRLDGTVNAIDVSQGRSTVLPDFGNIAAAGNGSSFLLSDEKTFWRSLIVSIFGTRFERDVETIVERYAADD